MANTTARGAVQIKGTNPQFLIEKVIRSRIYDSIYWKEHCFALTAESLIDKAVELSYIGGTFGAQKPTPFLCLLCKLLQIQPDKEVLLEYLAAEEFKYLRAVAAMYVRMTFRPIEVYETLEPMLNDYRKLRFRQMNGEYTLTHMDEYIDDLLTKDRVCELILPRLTRRDVLEEIEGLAPRTSKLEDALLLGDVDASLKEGGMQVGGAMASGSGSESEDSIVEEMREKRRRAERARRIREERGRQEGEVEGVESTAFRDGEEEGEYASQEDSEEEEEEGPGYVSRSPSRSVSPDRRDGGGTEEEEGYVSRSPSQSPDRQGEGAGGYVSKSPSRSADRSVSPE